MGRPIWEIKLVADLLLAASLLAYMFGVLPREQFVAIFMIVLNYIALNASERSYLELAARLKEVKALKALKADFAVKCAAVIFGILVAIALLLYAIDYDTAMKALSVVAIILVSNLLYYEYRLGRVRVHGHEG